MIWWEYVTLGSNKGTIRMIRAGFAYEEATDKGVDREPPERFIDLGLTAE